MVRGFTEEQIDELVRITRERHPFTHKHHSDDDMRLATIEVIHNSWRFRIVARVLFRLYGNKL